MKFLGLITHVSTGTVSKGQRAGSEWQQLSVEGIRLFVPEDLQNGFCKGQRVRCEVLYRGDKKVLDAAGNVMRYEPDYQLMTISVVPEVGLE